MAKYDSYIQRQKSQWGSKFSAAGLVKSFIPYFNSGDRVEVQFKYGKTSELKRGRIGVTTGWRPVFLLMLTARSMGSSYTIDKNAKVLRVISK